MSPIRNDKVLLRLSREEACTLVELLNWFCMSCETTAYVVENRARARELSELVDYEVAAAISARERPGH